MQQSGQIIAHIAQPEHSPVFWNSTALTPNLFNWLFFLIKPLGQKLMHNKQPLHLSLLIVIFAIFTSPPNF